MGYGLDGRVRFPKRTRDFYKVHSAKTGAEARLAYQISNRGRFFNLQERGANHSPPSGAEINNYGFIPPLRISFNCVMLNELSTGAALLFTCGTVIKKTRTF
jgi:hypothetical protein